MSGVIITHLEAEKVKIYGRCVSKYGLKTEGQPVQVKIKENKKMHLRFMLISEKVVSNFL